MIFHHIQQFLIFTEKQSGNDCGKSENPTYAFIDSQSVKTVYNSEKRRFDGGKKRKDERGT